MKKYAISLTFLLFLAVPVAAAQPGDGMPIEISADKTLEWHRNQKQYIANGNAVIVQGDTTIRAETITADYRDGNGKEMEIYRLRATGGVTIENRGNTAHGDTLSYTVDDGIATMTGSDLKMTSPDQTVTATEKFTYDVADGKITAYGDASIFRGNDTLRADTIDATLKDDGNGRRILERVTATGNVVIRTATESLTGAEGAYDAATNTATVSGGVKITRDQNVLTGDRATIDLTTNISRIFAAQNTPSPQGGRVRGTFYPGRNATTP